MSISTVRQSLDNARKPDVYIDVTVSNSFAKNDTYDMPPALAEVVDKAEGEFGKSAFGPGLLTSSRHVEKLNKAGLRGLRYAVKPKGADRRSFTLDGAKQFVECLNHIGAISTELRNTALNALDLGIGNIMRLNPQEQMEHLQDVDLSVRSAGADGVEVRLSPLPARRGNLLRRVWRVFRA